MKHANRISSQRARRGTFWCRRCDVARVGEIGRCRACGYRNDRKRIKGEDATDLREAEQAYADFKESGEKAIPWQGGE